MKIVKISPHHQITIPSIFRDLRKTGYFSIYQERNRLILHSVEIKNEQNLDDVIAEVLQKFKK